MSKVNKLQHYHLVSGTVMFTRPGEEVVEHSQLNTMITGDDKNVSAKHIGMAQQGLQMRLFEHTGPQVQVRDVFIISVSYLGHMTAEKFSEGISELPDAA